MFRRLFLDHPQQIGESYGEHLLAAGSFALTMIGAGLACLIHAIIPGLFVTTGSDMIERLHDRMVLKRRNRLQEARRAFTPTRGD